MRIMLVIITSTIFLWLLTISIINFINDIKRIKNEYERGVYIHRKW
jgi:hypothetical protein